MRDPAGDLPWEEDPTGSDVFHITDANVSIRPHTTYNLFYISPFSFYYESIIF